MPMHDDDHLMHVFNDTYTMLVERAPVAPTLEEITTRHPNSSRAASVVDDRPSDVDNSRSIHRVDRSIDRSVDADESGDDDPTVDYLPQPGESTATGRQKSWRGAAVAVAATILVVVGVVVVSDGNSGDVDTDPASVPGATDPVASPSVADPVASPAQADSDGQAGVVDSLGYRWYRLDPDDTGFPAGRLSAPVFAGGPGFVAVGSSALWTSVDGLTWSTLPHDEAALRGDESQSPFAVTEGGPGLVAVGSFGSNEDKGVVGDAAVWTSVDGITWSRVPHDDDVFGGTGEQWMGSVTVGGPGLVAVGGSGQLVGRDDNPDGIGGGAAVWTSVDGITWSRVAHDEDVFGGPGESWMNSVTPGGPGLVAVGISGRYEKEGVFGAAVWTSVDGITWSRVPDDEAVFGGAVMASVTAGGPGLVAVGSATADDSALGDGGDGVVWTSVDGLTWSRVPHDDSVFGGAGEQEMWEVIAGGPGLVVVGVEGYTEGEPWRELSPNGYVPVVWTSVDGISWSRVPYDEAVFGKEDVSLTMLSVPAGGPLVAVGNGGVIVAERVAD